MTHGGRRYIKYTDQQIAEVMSLRGVVSACKASVITGISRRYICNLWNEEFRK